VALGTTRIGAVRVLVTVTLAGAPVVDASGGGPTTPPWLSTYTSGRATTCAPTTLYKKALCRQLQGRGRGATGAGGPGWVVRSRSRLDRKGAVGNEQGERHRHGLGWARAVAHDQTFRVQARGSHRHRHVHCLPRALRVDLGTLQYACTASLALSYAKDNRLTAKAWGVPWVGVTVTCGGASTTYSLGMRVHRLDSTKVPVVCEPRQHTS
jgi:hypothetical protein